MGTSGRAILCPLGQRLPKRKKLPETPATREKAKHDKSQLSWGQKKCEEISKALNTIPKAPDVPHDNQSDSGDDVPNEYFAHFWPLGPDAEEQEEENLEDVHTYVQMVSGRTYQHQRLREHQHWKDIMQKVFIAFMKSSDRTSDWGDDLRWNHNFNDEEDCSCGPRSKRTRAIDTMDLIYRRKIDFEFCSCTPDQVRLIRQGYLGGSPKDPETAFSLRLYCHSNIHPFSLMIDKFLDAHNPLITVPGTTEPRLWRKPLSAAVYCYRQILKMIEELEARALNLTPLERLASNCPRCFGPAGAHGIQKGPQYVVCVDGNFQQRCHESASKEIDEIKISHPSSFMRAEEDPCTSQHTAAADCRDASSWRGCEETGLIGMACRHDHMLKLVNFIRSGEKAYFVHALIGLLFDSILEARTETNDASVGLLYDIGCTLEKGVIKVRT
ncbi:hypothetical protein DFH28DRAFT_1084730 [Melampsora americana]|nr:hypothetical protein DFH28DRAFT_1084730 [Melampsora americana]